MATKLKNNTVMLGEELKERVLVIPPNHITDYLLGNTGVYSGKKISETAERSNEERRIKRAAERAAIESKTSTPNTFQTVLAKPRRKKKKPRKKAQNDEDLE